MTTRKTISPFKKEIIEYTEVYLPYNLRVTAATQRSYASALNMFEAFLAEKNPKIQTEEIARSHVEDFLDSLERRGCIANTRNQRRACIVSFFEYRVKRSNASEKNARYRQYIDIESIAQKRCSDPDHSHTLSEEEINAILNTVDNNPNARLRVRDKTILVILYETAARISELLGTRIADLNLAGRHPYIHFRGKGRKTRNIELTRATVELIRDYARFHNIDLVNGGDEPLFYVCHKGYREYMTTNNAERMLQKYADRARVFRPNIPKKVTPHMFRHARATNLYHSHGLAYVSMILGHESIATTARYIGVDFAASVEAIERSSRTYPKSLQKHLNSHQGFLDNPELEAELYRLS